MLFCVVAVSGGVVGCCLLLVVVFGWLSYDIVVCWLFVVFIVWLLFGLC